MDRRLDPAFDEGAAEIRAQAGLYRFLGRCFEDEVDTALLDLLRGTLADGLVEAGLDLGVEFGAAPVDALLPVLAEEYAALFVVPGAVRPFRSVFETGAVFHWPADEAAAAYREAGYAFRRRYSGEFPDHIGTMLSFLGHLAGVEADALARGEPEVAAGWRARRERFLLRQLGPWAPGWCRRARWLARHRFYVEILGLAERVLWDELSRLADRRELKRLAELNRRPPVRLEYDADFRKASGL